MTPRAVIIGDDRRRPGYALVLTLIVLGLMATVMAGLARTSATRAGDAARAERDLQLRWGTRTLRDTLHAQADAVLHPEVDTDDDDAAYRPTRFSSVAAELNLRLGGFMFRAVLSDEQAKANANHLLEQHGHAEANQMLVELSSAAYEPWPVRFAPHLPEHAQRFGGLPIDGYGRLFDGVRARIAADDGRRLPIDDVTCWGDGRLHLRRASDAAVRAALRGHVENDAVGRLLAARLEDPDAPVETLLQAIDLTGRQRQSLLRRLTDASACHSVRITATNDRGAWPSMTVYTQRENGADDPNRPPLTFTWRP